jgi:hypothetical protein
MSPVFLLSIAKIGQKVSLEIATINQLCEKKSLSLKKKQLIELLQEQTVEHIQAAIIGSKTFRQFVWCCQGFDVIANFTYVQIR